MDSAMFHGTKKKRKKNKYTRAALVLKFDSIMTRQKSDISNSKHTPNRFILSPETIVQICIYKYIGLSIYYLKNICFL